MKCALCSKKFNQGEARYINDKPICLSCQQEIKKDEFSIEENRLYTLKQVSDLSGYSVNTLRRRLEAGQLKRVSRPNLDVKILGSEVKRFLGMEENGQHTL